MTYDGIENEEVFRQEFARFFDFIRRARGACPPADVLLDPPPSGLAETEVRRFQDHVNVCGECYRIRAYLKAGWDYKEEEATLRDWSGVDKRLTERMNSFLKTQVKAQGPIRLDPGGQTPIVQEYVAKTLTILMSHRAQVARQASASPQPKEPTLASKAWEGQPALVTEPIKQTPAAEESVVPALTASGPPSPPPVSPERRALPAAGPESPPPTDRPDHPIQRVRDRLNIKGWSDVPRWVYAAVLVFILALPLIGYTVFKLYRTVYWQKKHIAAVAEEREAFSKIMSELTEKTMQKEKEAAELAERLNQTSRAYANPFFFLLRIKPPSPPGTGPPDLEYKPTRVRTIKIPPNAQILDLMVNLEDNQTDNTYRIEIHDPSGSLLFESDHLRKDMNGNLQIAIPKNTLASQAYLMKIYLTLGGRHQRLAEQRFNVILQ